MGIELEGFATSEVKDFKYECCKDCIALEEALDQEGVASHCWQRP